MFWAGLVSIICLFTHVLSEWFFIVWGANGTGKRGQWSPFSLAYGSSKKGGLFELVKAFMQFNIERGSEFYFSWSRSIASNALLFSTLATFDRHFFHRHILVSCRDTFIVSAVISGCIVLRVATVSTMTRLYVAYACITSILEHIIAGTPKGRL